MIPASADRAECPACGSADLRVIARVEASEVPYQDEAEIVTACNECWHEWTEVDQRPGPPTRNILEPDVVATGSMLIGPLLASWALEPDQDDDPIA